MALPIDVQAYRKIVLNEILGNENRVDRKGDALKRFEIYRDRQDQFVVEKLAKEFGPETTKEMRKITSINLTKRIVNEQASIYKREPQRQFLQATEQQQAQLDELYFRAKSNVSLKKANQYYKLFDQCALQVWPKDGKIALRVLAPHQYDVLEDPENPEKGEVYILNVMDKSEFLLGSDRTNQNIADQNDYEKERMRFIWWSADFNFITNGNGALMGEVIPNPIKRLPFIDISAEKDFEFWVRRGKNIVGFNLDFSAMLSDIATISKIQGYAQAIVTGSNLPENITMGPTRLIRLPTDGTETSPPTFEFANPSPDLNASLELLNITLNYFLTSEGLDPALVSGKTDIQKFSSGFERFLAEISKFSATRDDFDLFKDVEQELFELLKLWSNELQNTDSLIPELKQAMITDTVNMEITFAKPEIHQTEQEKLDVVIKKLDNGLISKIEAVAELRDISEEDAEEVLKKIAEEKMAMVEMLGVGNGQIEANNESDPEVQPNGAFQQKAARIQDEGNRQ